MAVVDGIAPTLGLPQQPVLPVEAFAKHPEAASGAQPEELARVATSLLDIRTCLEGDLRTLTSMQRSLERVRTRGTVSAEAQLLLGEMARQLEGLRDTCNGLGDRLRVAGYELDAVRRA